MRTTIQTFKGWLRDKILRALRIPGAFGHLYDEVAILRRAFLAHQDDYRERCRRSNSFVYDVIFGVNDTRSHLDLPPVRFRALGFPESPFKTTYQPESPKDDSYDELSTLSYPSESNEVPAPKRTRARKARSARKAVRS